MMAACSTRLLMSWRRRSRLASSLRRQSSSRLLLRYHVPVAVTAVVCAAVELGKPLWQKKGSLCELENFVEESKWGAGFRILKGCTGFCSS